MCIGWSRLSIRDICLLRFAPILHKIQVSLHKTPYPNFRSAAFSGKIGMPPAFVLMLVGALGF